MGSILAQLERMPQPGWISVLLLLPTR